jgi:hypothetical protein
MRARIGSHQATDRSLARVSHAERLRKKAGYAGGIVSAAMDGERVARAVAGEQRNA